MTNKKGDKTRDKTDIVTNKKGDILPRTESTYVPKGNKRRRKRDKADTMTNKGRQDQNRRETRRTQ